MKSFLLLFIFIFQSYGFQIDDKSILENFIEGEISGQPTFHDIKCGTRYDLAVEGRKDEIDPGLYETYVQSKKSEPVRQRSVLTPAGFFQLHWDDLGTHAVPQEDLSGNGYPDYIDSAVVILDHVWKIQVEQMEYLPPPGEDGNPAIPYHIYFTNHYNYGVTWKGDLIEANLPDTSFTSYIEIDNDFSEYYFPTKGLDGLKVTAAHEFHHAIQLGYNFRDEDIYFFEMTSTWMEEHLYPNIDDYLNYLDYFFEVVSNSRFDFNNYTYPYANSIYLQMLEEQHGAIIVRSVWEKIRTEKSMSALISTLEENNSTLFESLGEYGLWLYYTGERTIPDKYFSDALFFPEISIKNEDIIDFDEAYVDDVTIEGFANRYLEFQEIKGKIINIQVIGDNNLESGFRIISPYSNSILYPVNTKISPELINSDQMVVILSNSEKFEILTTVDVNQEGSIDISSIYPFPNPVNTLEGEYVRFQNVPPEAALHIFNTSGKRIARVENQGTSQVRSWYLMNDDGHKVAGGIYMFLVQGDGLLKTGKFSIIR